VSALFIEASLADNPWGNSLLLLRPHAATTGNKGRNCAKRNAHDRITNNITSLWKLLIGEQ
ncbi:MAG: hypothetical protein IJU65_06635, partial [Desulfovibrio sp.]|nr:hypothetical protein [Desulfovibrio sp.]